MSETWSREVVRRAVKRSQGIDTLMTETERRIEGRFWHAIEHCPDCTFAACQMPMCVAAKQREETGEGR